MKSTFIPFCLAIVVLLAANNSNAQTFTWAKNIGSPSLNSYLQPTANTIDAAGNYYVLGVFNGTYDFDPGTSVVNLTGNTNGQDVFIQKFSPTGTLLWAKGLTSTSAYMESVAIKTDNNGNVFLTGSFDAPVDFDPGAAVNLISPQGPQDFFILKLTSAGALSWVKTIGVVSTYAVSAALTVSITGNVIVGGYYDGPLDFDPGPAVVSKTPISQDGFILSLTNAGVFAWVKTFESNQYASVQRLATDASGNILVTGTFSDSTDFDPSAATAKLTSMNAINFGSDVFVVKLTSTGNYVWAKSFGGNDDEMIVDLAIDNNGNAILAGNFQGQVDFDPGATVFNMMSAGPFSMDAYILKLSPTGSFIWAKQLTGPSEEYIGSIAVDNLGMIYATGYFDDQVDFDPGPVINTITPAANSVDGYVLKLDPSGNFMRVNQINSVTADNEGGFLIAVDNNHNIYSTGLFEATLDLDPQATVQNVIPIGADLDAYYFKWGQCIPSTSTINATGCTYVLNGTTYSGNGTYTQLFNSASGCDSLVTLNLTGSSTNTYLNPTVCNTNYTLNSQTYTASGNYVQFYTNQANCDSNFYINLTIGAQSFNTVQITACDFYFSGQNVYGTSGVYTEIYTNATGCDSTLTLVLTILQSQTNTLNVSACGSYVFNNNTLTSSGFYSNTFLAANGCDSTVDLNLTIVPTINKTVTLLGNTLSAQAGPPMSYQWVTCPGYTFIPGANAQTYTPSANGSYAVILNNGSCKDTSVCTNFVFSGLNETIALATEMNVYPNPIIDLLNIDFKEAMNNVTLSLTTISGQVLQSISLKEVEKTSLNLQSYPAGIYFLNVNSEGRKASFKVVKQ